MEDILNIYLPIAATQINVLYLLLISVAVGTIVGTFGLGGGIIMVPVLTFLGIPTKVAVASVTNLITASSFSGYLAYAKRNRIDYILGLLLLSGGIAGVFLGILLFNYLSYLGKIDFVISIIFIILLSALSVITATDSLLILYRKVRKIDKKNKALQQAEIKSSGFIISLPSSKYPVHVFAPILVGVMGGILISMLGIGGSIIMIPAMIYILRISDGFTAGTAHLQMIFTSIIATVLHGISSNSLDIVLTSIMILGNVMGVQIGVRVASRFRPDYYRVILAAIIMALCFKVAHNLFSVPTQPYTIERKSR